MNVYHQAKMSLRHYLSFTQLWRWILPLAYIGQTASKCTLPDGSEDGKGAVFLTQKIQDQGILVAFEAYFGHASWPVSLQVWRPVGSNKYSVNGTYAIQPTSELGMTEVHEKDLLRKKCMRVCPGDRLGIKIRETPANDSRIQFDHQFSVAATIKPPDHAECKCPNDDDCFCAKSGDPTLKGESARETGGKADGPDDGKGGVFLTQEIQKPGILVDFDAYFGHANWSVSLELWERDNYSDCSNYRVKDTIPRDTRFKYALTENYILKLPEKNSVQVKVGDRLGIRIQEATQPPACGTGSGSWQYTHSEEESQIQFRHQFFAAATIKPATTTPTPQPPTTSDHEVHPSSPEVAPTKSLKDTTSLMSPPSTTSTLEEKSSALDKTTQITDTTSLMSPPSTTSTLEEKSSALDKTTLIIVVVLSVIIAITTIVGIIYVVIVRMRRRKPADKKLEQDYNEIYLDGSPYSSIRSENTDSMTKGPRALRKDRPRLKLDPDTPLQVNPDRVSNVRVTYLQWISDMMPEVGLTGRHPNPVKNAGRVTGSSAGDGDDDGERYLKPISERSGFDNPVCDVIAYQTDDVFFAQLDPGQFMLPSGAIDSSDRPTRLPWGIPGDSPMTPQSNEDDQTYIDMNHYHYSPTPRGEKSNGSDGGLAGNEGADRGPHTYLELLPDDDDVTGQRSKQAKHVTVLGARRSQALPGDESVDADPYMEIDPLQTDSLKARRARKLTDKSIVEAFSNEVNV